MHVQPLYEYFYNNSIQGINKNRFPINLWSCVSLVENDIPRTNNGIEGWHNVFKRSFNEARYSFTLLIKKLKMKKMSPE